MAETEEPDWLVRMRQAAVQRPRTQFQKVRWSDLQQLLRERDYLLAQAGESTILTLQEMQKHQYGRGPQR